jgi:hypothetical protein
MFQFPHLPPHFAVLTHYGEGVAPFGDLRIGLSAAPRSLSQRNHVLLRPWLPRHPPYALIRLISYLAPHLCTHRMLWSAKWYQFRSALRLFNSFAKLNSHFASVSLYHLRLAPLLASQYSRCNYSHVKVPALTNSLPVC